MTRLLRIILLLLPLLAGSTVVAQTTATPSSPDHAEVIRAAREIMKKAQFCTLATVAETGQPQLRIMDPSEPTADFTIWLGTNSRSRKVAQLEAESRAALNYFDPATLSYVTLLGEVTLVSDAGQKAKHWQSKWAPFYPDGSDDPNLLFIRFTPHRLEIVSSAHGFMSDPQTWTPVSIDFE